ncbi:MAG: tetratricopeptide repeat protein [Chloroflexi bacterium]|nr:tetratricopeptide repeat protein [Chloroflexota bacterium]
MQHKRRRANPFRVIFLALLIIGLVYLDRMVIPTMPPLFVSTPTPTRPPESFISAAQSLEEAGKYSQAILAYGEAVQADPRNPASYVALARLEAYTGNYEEAIKNATNAILLNEKNDTAYALMGWAYGLAGDYIKAVGALQEAININKENAVAYAYLAEVYIYMLQTNQGQLDTMDLAIAASKAAITLAPDRMETYRGRGFVLEYTGNYDQAVSAFEAANALNPNIADLHLALGRNYRATLQYDKAITEFSRANALNPRDPMPETLISRTYFTNGDYQKAIQYAEAALTDDPSDPTLYGNLGLVFWKNKQYLDAVDMLRLAVSGGTTAAGVIVPGLEMDYGRVGEYYYTYGLALAKTSQCGEALQISQAVAVGLRNDDIAAYNAQEVIVICEQLAKQGGSEVSTATLLPTLTPLQPQIPALTQTPIPQP